MLHRVRAFFKKRRSTAGDDVPAWTAGYASQATETDIFYCFRLLLGRHPHREEWRGHAARAGQNLDAIVASFLNSAEFAGRGLLERGLAQRLEIASLPDFRIYLSPDDLDVGRHVRVGSYEPEVAAVFRRLVRPGMTVVDIGANIGYFTLLLAALVGPEGRVLAVEPNGRNLRMLEASRRLNGFDHVVPIQVAASRSTGLLELHASHSNGTTTALRTGRETAALDALLAAETVPALRLGDILPADRRVALVKVDVEGAEYNALLGCEAMIARDRPTIVSEFNPAQLPGISSISGPDYLSWLVAQGYRIAVIEPDGSTTVPGIEPGPVMAAHEARGADHIDILATPA